VDFFKAFSEISGSNDSTTLLMIAAWRMEWCDHS